MRMTEETIKNGRLKAIIILILIISIIALAGFAFARYITKINGTATADIAKWSIKVNGSTNQNFVIDLATTRTGVTQEAEVQQGYIGPGTAGAFQIELDATGSEASLEYDINFNIDYTNNESFPKNLIFYSDSTMQNAIYHDDGGINLNGFIGWNDNSQVHTKTIYWSWSYETGSTQNEINANDELDSYWIGKPISLSMNVTAKQVNENPTTGQYAVTFDANGGTLQGYGNSSQATKMVTYGEIYGSLPTPTREGYAFKGWNGKNLFNIENVALANGNIIDNKIVLDGSIVEDNVANYVANSLYYNGTFVKNFNNVFIKDNTFNKIRTKLNTSKRDPAFSYDISNLKDNTRYIFSYYEIEKDYSHAKTSFTNIQLEEGLTATDYEPYYITSSTEVVQNQNHTLTAIWEPNP